MLTMVCRCSAVLASSAVPPFLRPIRLIQKDENGTLSPFEDFGMCWSDGAIKADIPAKLLAEVHNVNYLIVCQVNPRKSMMMGFLLCPVMTSQECVYEDDNVHVRSCRCGAVFLRESWIQRTAKPTLRQCLSRRVHLQHSRDISQT